MIPFIIKGTLLGLAAGLSPGPILLLVISETLRHNLSAGLKVAIVPLITDIPLIILSFFILVQFSNFTIVFGCLSVLGGLYLLYLGYESFNIKAIDLNIDEVKPKSLQKGILANLLNPNPYIFWFSVGTPIIVKAMENSFLSATGFIGSFFLFIVGTKAVLAVLVGKSRNFLKGRSYVWIMRILGLLLIVFSMFFFRDGLQYFGILQAAPPG